MKALLAPPLRPARPSKEMMAIARSFGYAIIAGVSMPQWHELQRAGGSRIDLSGDGGRLIIVEGFSAIHY